jgi:hypothetical protein
MVTIGLKTLADRRGCCLLKRLTASCIPSSYRRVRMQ